jgi:hypothetical protein
MRKFRRLLVAWPSSTYVVIYRLQLPEGDGGGGVLYFVVRGVMGGGGNHQTTRIEIYAVVWRLINPWRARGDGPMAAHVPFYIVHSTVCTVSIHTPQYIEIQNRSLARNQSEPTGGTSGSTGTYSWYTGCTPGAAHTYCTSITVLFLTWMQPCSTVHVWVIHSFYHTTVHTVNFCLHTLYDFMHVLVCTGTRHHGDIWQQRSEEFANR